MAGFEKNEFKRDTALVAKLPVAVDLSVSAVMRRKGFLQPDVQELMLKMTEICRAAKADSAEGLASSVLLEPLERKQHSDQILMAVEFGGSNARYLIAHIGKGEQLIQLDSAKAGHESLKPLKLKYQNMHGTGRSSFERILNAAIKTTLRQAVAVIRAHPQSDLKFAFVWSNAIDVQMSKGRQAQVLTRITDSYSKPDFEGVAIPEGFDLQAHIKGFLQKVFKKRNIEVLVENDASLVAALKNEQGDLPEAGVVICTGLGAAVKSEARGGMVNIEPGHKLKLSGVATEMLRKREGGESDRLQLKLIENAEDICSGDKLIELLNFWVSDLAKDFPELSKFTEIAREQRHGKRRIISRRQALTLAREGGNLETALDTLRNAFDPSGKHDLKLENFQALLQISKELLGRALGVAAACLSGIAGAQSEGKSKVLINIDTTVFGSERLLGALEAQTNVICQTNSFPPVELRLIKPQAVGRSREALSVPLQGMLSLHGFKLSEKS